VGPRAKKATDGEIFAAVMSAVSRLGPNRMTLADVAQEVGLTAGALVQRFGSKRDLLLAAVRSWNESPERGLTDLRATVESPVAALIEYAACVARWIETPEEMANQLAMLQLDVTDPDFRVEAARYFKAERETLKAWLDQAVQAGELEEGIDTERLAVLVQTSLGGGRLVWMILEDEDPEKAARREIETLLGPYRREIG
jgi:AcrR family transcriptional regulator